MSKIRKWKRWKGYRGHCTATTQKGQPCRTVALANETVCALHLPVDDPRRVLAIVENTRRLRAYWSRWRAEKAQREAA